MKKVICLLLLFASCIDQPKTSLLKTLHSFEGRYQYINGSVLDMVTSPLDTTLYAVIDGAKYPLHYKGANHFIDIGGSDVYFQRDANDQAVSYSVGGDTFQIISTIFDRPVMVPRENLLANPEEYRYEAPASTNDGLTVGEIHQLIDRPGSLLEMVRETIAGHYPDVHSILISKNSKLVLEEYFYGHDLHQPHQLRSATKPFIGALIGIAIDRGLIGSETDELLPYFEDIYPNIKNVDEGKKSITIEDFLRYRHGLDCANNAPESIGNEARMMESEDWVKHTLDLPMITKPASRSSYCTGCALVLGSLIEIVAGQSLEDFAHQHFFGPMGIDNYKWIFEPNQSSLEHFSQLSITSRDLMKLASMYSQKGQWNGQQIIPQSWVEKTFIMEKGDYGYLWEHKYYILEGKQYDSYLASGNGGQKISIWPDLDMITVFTGGNYNSYQLYGKSTPPNEMIPRYILKAVQ